MIDPNAITDDERFSGFDADPTMTDTFTLETLARYPGVLPYSSGDASVSTNSTEASTQTSAPLSSESSTQPADETLSLDSSLLSALKEDLEKSKARREQPDKADSLQKLQETLTQENSAPIPTSKQYEGDPDLPEMDEEELPLQSQEAAPSVSEAFALDDTPAMHSTSSPLPDNEEDLSFDIDNFENVTASKSKTSSRKWVYIAAAACLVAILLGGGGYYYWQRSHAVAADSAHATPQQIAEHSQHDTAHSTPSNEEHNNAEHGHDSATSQTHGADSSSEHGATSYSDSEHHGDANEAEHGNTAAHTADHSPTPTPNTTQGTSHGAVSEQGNQHGNQHGSDAHKTPVTDSHKPETAAAHASSSHQEKNSHPAGKTEHTAAPKSNTASNLPSHSTGNGTPLAKEQHKNIAAHQTPSAKTSQVGHTKEHSDDHAPAHESKPKQEKMLKQVSTHQPEKHTEQSPKLTKKDEEKESNKNKTADKNPAPVANYEQTKLVPKPVLKDAPASPKGIFTVQVYSTPSRDDAEDWMDRLKTKNVSNPFITQQSVRGQTYYRVRFGSYTTRQEAESAAMRLGFASSWVDRVR